MNYSSKGSVYSLLSLFSIVALEEMCLVKHKCDIFKYCDYGDLQKSIMLGLESKEVLAFLWLSGLLSSIFQSLSSCTGTHKTGNSEPGRTTLTGRLILSICLIAVLERHNTHRTLMSIIFKLAVLRFERSYHVFHHSELILII